MPYRTGPSPARRRTGVELGLAALLFIGCESAFTEDQPDDGRPDATSDEGGGAEEGGGEPLPWSTQPRLYLGDVAPQMGLGLGQGADEQLPECTGFAIDGVMPPAEDCELRRFGGGAAVADFDGDGWPDLFMPRMGGPDALYRNLGQGAGFEEVAADWGVADPGQHMASAWVDLDLDGDLDLVISGQGHDPHEIYLREEDTFVRHLGAWRDSFAAPDGVGGTSVVVGDIDRDGRPELLFLEWARPRHKPSSSPWNLRVIQSREEGGVLILTDATVAFGLSELNENPDPIMGFSGSIVDFDADGRPDLLLTADYGHMRWFRGSEAGPLQEAQNPGLDIIDYGMGTAVADFDGDGDLDAYISSIGPDPDFPGGADLGFPYDANHLMLNDGAGQFRDGDPLGEERDCGYGWGVLAGDLDNDGRIDLAATNGFEHPDPILDESYRNDRNCIFLQAGPDDAPSFVRQGEAAGFEDRGQGRGLYALDFDLDGDIDLLQTRNADTPRLWKNDGPSQRAWLQVRPISPQGSADARDALVAVRAGPEAPWQLRAIGQDAQHLGHGELVASFGFGDFDGVVDEIRVCWQSSSRMAVLRDVPTRQRLDVAIDEQSLVISEPCLVAIRAD